MNLRRYRMTARAEQVEQTANRILDAALAAWAANPYDRIRLEDLARNAAVTVPTIVRRYGGKAGVIVALVERELIELVATRTLGSADPTAVVLSDLVAFYRRYGSLILKMYAEAPLIEGLPEPAARARAYHVAWCRSVFADRLPAADDVTTARRLAQLVAVCDATTWRILAEDGGLDDEQLHRALVELVEPLLA